MTTPTYMHSRDAENGREFSDFENPLAFPGETNGGTLGNDSNRPSAPPMAVKTSSSWHRHRWNTVLRVITLISTLASTILLSFFANEDIPNSNAKVEYKSYSSFVFLLAANVIAHSCVPILMVIGCVMGRKGKRPTNTSFLVTVVIINLIGATLLLVACSAALAVELVNRTGATVFSSDDSYSGSENWAALCKDLHIGKFCSVIEAALAFSFLGYLTMMASICFDVYDIYKLKM